MGPCTKLHDPSLPSLLGPEGASGASAHPYRGKKRTVWEGGTRSIAFIHAPPILMPAGGRMYDGLLHISDWPATMVGLAGGGEFPSGEAKRAKGETAAAISGMDVWGAVSKALPSPRTDLLYNFDQVIGCGALRRGRYKLVQNGNCGTPPNIFGVWDTDDGAPAAHEADGEGFQLYDLETDPFERAPVVDAGHPAAAELRAAYEAYSATAVEALSWTTPGDPAASPALHEGRWVPWLEDDYRRGRGLSCPCKLPWAHPGGLLAQT